MGDRNSFLSLGVSDPDNEHSPLTFSALPNGVVMHADEALPPKDAPHAIDVQPAPLHHNEDDRPPPAGTLPQEELPPPPPLHAFFAVRADHAVAAVAPEEEDAVTQRRWRADAAEVEAFLMQLDEAREACAQAGLLTKAQACMRRMEQAVHLFAARLHAEADAVAARSRTRMAEQQRRHTLNLRHEWRGRVAAYKRDAAALLAAAEQHYYAEMEREDVRMRAELRRSGHDATDSANSSSSSSSNSSESPSSHAWSKEARHLEYEVQQLLRQRRYAEAERVRVELLRLRRRESTTHQRNVSQQHAQRLHALRLDQAAKIAQMQAAQRQEIAEMTSAARAAVDALTQRYLAVSQALEDRRLYLHEQARSIVRGYKHADVLDPKETGLKLIRLSQLLWTPIKEEASLSGKESRLKL